MAAIGCTTAGDSPAGADAAPGAGGPALDPAAPLQQLDGRGTTLGSLVGGRAAVLAFFATW
jgi:hypothetical protein